MAINWIDPYEHVTPHFTVQEACWLPRWRSLYYPDESERANLIRTCGLMEMIRHLLGLPIAVQCMIRPPEYNKLVKGAKHSMHLYGLACDFRVIGMECDTVRANLEQELGMLGCRMEDLPGASWVHVDLKTPLPGHKRYFKP